MSATGEAAYTSPVPKVRPAKVWYWVFAGLIAVSLLAAAAIWIAGRINVEDQVRAFARFPAPGNAELRFKRAGQYTVYYEFRSEIDGQDVSAPPSPPPGIALDLKDEAGQSLELRRVAQEFTYDAGAYEAVSLRRVLIPRPGLYRLSAAAPGPDRFAISVGRGATPSTDSYVRSAALVGIIGSALGLIGLITVGVLRSRSRAGLRGAPVPAAGPWPGEPFDDDASTVPADAAWAPAPDAAAAVPSPFAPVAAPGDAVVTPAPLLPPSASAPAPGAPPPGGVGWAPPSGASVSDPGAAPDIPSPALPPPSLPPPGS